MEYLRAWRVCCISDALRTPGTIAWRIFGVFCSPLRRLPLPWGFVVEGLLWSAPLGRLHHWRAWIHPSLRLTSSSALAWRFLGDPWSLGRWYSPGKFPGVLDRSVPSALIWTGCFCQPLRRTVASIATRLIGAYLGSPVIWGRLFPGASLERLLNFRSSDQVRSSGVLSHSHLYLFDSQLLLDLSLVSVGGGEEINV